MHALSRLTRVALLALLGLAGCRAHGDPSRPVPSAAFPAPQPAHRLVVVLPGRADDLDALRRSGAVQAVQQAWPDADVVLAELTMDYYLAGDAPRRLHDDVVAPARAQGYDEVWMAGASLGGMGTVLYDRQYPGELSGLVLLAPFLGGTDIVEEIGAAGGLADWQAGPELPMEQGWRRELWRHVQGWAGDPAAGRRVWVVYGDRDRLRRALPLLRPVLPADHVLVRPGGHRWSVWAPALGEVLRAADSERQAAGSLPRPAVAAARSPRHPG